MSPDNFAREAAREAAREDHGEKPADKPAGDPFAKAILRDLARARATPMVLRAATGRQTGEETVQTQSPGKPTVQTRPPGLTLIKHAAPLIRSQVTKTSPPSVLQPKAPHGPVDPARLSTNYPQRLLVLKGAPPWIESRAIITALKDISPEVFPRTQNPFRLARCEIRRSPTGHSATAFLEFYDAHGAEVVCNRLRNGERIFGFYLQQAVLHDVARFSALIGSYEKDVFYDTPRRSVIKHFPSLRISPAKSTTTNASENGGAS